MKFIKKNIGYILFFIILLILTSHFNVTKDNWFLYSHIEEQELFKYFNGSPLLSFIALIKNRFIKSLISSVTIILTFILSKNLINKNNKTLFPLMSFLFIILGKIFTYSIVSYNGLVNNLIVINTLLLYLNIILEKIRIKKHNIFPISLVLSIISPLSTFIMLSVTTIEFISNIIKKDKDEKITSLLLGEVLGTMFMLFSLHIPINTHISSNIIHIFTPTLKSTNILIPLILLTYFIYIVIKVWRLEKKTKYLCLISLIINILSIILISILNNNYILYILILIYNLSSLYLLMNANSSIVFKKHIRLIYLIKYFYLISLHFTSLLNESYVLLYVAFDVILLLEVVNYIFPKNFLNKLWYSITIVTYIMYICIYRSNYIKINELNNYIKSNLECNYVNIKLPYKYSTSDLYYYLPKSDKEKDLYLKYLKLDKIKYEINNTK